MKRGLELRRSAIARASLLLCLVPGSLRADTPTVKTNMDLAFVLLPKAGLPNGKDVVSSFRRFATDGQGLELSAGANGQNAILQFEVKPCGTAFVASMPAPVPQGEAEEAAQFSISGMGTGRKLPPHAAHLIVTLPAVDARSRLSSVSCFTSLLAAVSTASGAIGVYWGNAGATHHADFFASVAEERGLANRLMLWTGVSIAREADGRRSFLSLGMQQLDLPDLLLVVPQSLDGNDALGTLFDLLAYLVQRGEPLPEGDTVGRSAEERLPVHYVTSPVDAKKRVWRVEIK